MIFCMSTTVDVKTETTDLSNVDDIEWDLMEEILVHV